MGCVRRSPTAGSCTCRSREMAIRSSVVVISKGVGRGGLPRPGERHGVGACGSPCRNLRRPITFETTRPSPASARSGGFSGAG